MSLIQRFLTQGMPVIVVLIPLAMVFLTYRWFVKRLPKDGLRLVVQAVGIYMLFAFAAWFSWRIFDYHHHLTAKHLILLITWLATAMGEIAIFLAAIAFVRTWRPELLDPFGGDVRPVSQRELTKILRADEFLTAINEALPRGDADTEHGLDYIPYLLQAVRQRRDRFQKSASRFLTLTIIAGVISILMVTAFGWVLLEDGSVGVPRTLADIRRILDTLDTSVQSVGTDFRVTREYDRVREVVSESAGPRLEPMRQGITTFVATMPAGPAAYEKLLQSLKGNALRIAPTNEIERRFQRDLLQAAADMEAWDAQQRRIPQSVQTAVTRFEQLMVRLEGELSKDQSRVAELVRRIAIGLIVVTFLLALVRFLGGLYRADYREALRADLDDMFVRSFFISFKAAGTDATQRAAAVDALVSSMTSARVAEKPSSASGPSFRKDETDLLKEIIAAAAKKL